MKMLLFGIYRIIVPKPFRTKILKIRLRKKIIEHFGRLPGSEITGEQREVLDYLEKSPLAIFPYIFVSKYNPSDIEVFSDPALGMRYILLDGKRLYFKKAWSENRIRSGWSDLLREQDPVSPHRYLTKEFDVSENDVIADIGAAEGNFSLSVIERVRKCCIFEYNRHWVTALNATFNPFAGKTEIINKMVSGSDDKWRIRLDTFLNEREDVTFLKIDVDGAEKTVIGSCLETLRSNRPLKIALCTYHKADDEKDFTGLLRGCGFEVKPSYGYMIPFYDKNIKAPWLRRGLIRAIRS